MKLINHFLNCLAKTLLKTLGRFPKGLFISSTTVLGSLTFQLARRHRKIAIENLTKAFGRAVPRKKAGDIARRLFINLWRIVFELGWSLTVPSNQLKQHFTISGLAIYRKAAAKGKGVILLGAHFGNWELLPVIGQMAQIPLCIVYRPLDAPFLEELIKNARTRYGAQMIPTTKGAMRKIYWNLRQGKTVGLLMDQSADWHDGVITEFFSQRTFTNSGMALLALKSEAPVVPLFLIREESGYRAVFGPELPLIKTGDRTRDIEANTQQYNWVIETYARMYPDQWFWVHRRWKNLPFCPLPRTHPRIGNRY